MEQIPNIVKRISPEKIGLFLLAIISVVLITLKAMIAYNIGINSSIYNSLEGFAIALPFFLAAALLLILYRFISKNYIIMIVVYLVFLIIGFVAITPLLTGAV